MKLKYKQYYSMKLYEFLNLIYVYMFNNLSLHHIYDSRVNIKFTFIIKGNYAFILSDYDILKTIDAILSDSNLDINSFRHKIVKNFYKYIITFNNPSDMISIVPIKSNVLCITDPTYALYDHENKIVQHKLFYFDKKKHVIYDQVKPYNDDIFINKNLYKILSGLNDKKYDFYRDLLRKKDFRHIIDNIIIDYLYMFHSINKDLSLEIIDYLGLYHINRHDEADVEILFSI